MKLNFDKDEPTINWDPNESLEDQLKDAINSNDIKNAESLLRTGANVNDGRGNLASACVHKNIQMVKLLLAFGADVHEPKYLFPGWGPAPYNDQPLITAVLVESVDIVKLLIEKGANVNAQQGAPLMEACDNGNTAIIKILVEAGADIHRDNDVVFLRACYNNRLSAVKLLLDLGINVHTREDEAVRIASSSGFEALTSLLLERGADPSKVLGEVNSYLSPLDDDDNLEDNLR